MKSAAWAWNLGSRKPWSGDIHSLVRDWLFAAWTGVRRRLKIIQEADAILIEELHSAGLYRTIQQAFVVLLPVQTVEGWVTTAHTKTSLPFERSRRKTS